MGELLVHCSQDEIAEAIQEFLVFEELDCSVRRLASLDELTSIEAAQGLVLQDDSGNRKILNLARMVREGSVHGSMPMLVMLHDLDAYLKTICYDLEYVLPCSFPIQSADLVPSLKKVIFFSRKRQKALALRDQISMLFKQNNHAAALPVIAQYAEEGKDVFRGHLLKAKAHMALRQFKLASEEALAAVHENRNSLEARITLALVYQEAGMVEKSYEVLNKSVALAPKHPRFLTLMGNMSLDGGQYEEALQKFEASLQLDEFQDEARSGLIVTEVLLGKVKDARERLKAATQVKTITRYAQLRVLQMAKAGRHADAQKLLESMVKLIPGQKDIYKVWMNLGLQAKREGELARAEQYFKAAQESAPQDYTKAKEQLDLLRAS
ncbi:MAG TPA: tetratricopeptide repeat protein [Oligoflexus sp.]|uniref:tetratricopeptide repeat protein n=1 Tax=Oligoflexus sp. TaxID=1971216 RepID=UPI002D7E37F4|nr:tetratricopeptide repeat protein [Oligoflexus sp.]HET9237535.1 tetratricopeptide repeat protein [Oligoflexus sp.]